MPENTLEIRLNQVIEPLTQNGIALAFSGGCDSSLLLFLLAHLQKERDFPLSAVFFHTPFQTAAELARVRSLTEQVNLPLTVLSPQVLEIPEVRNNDRRRCYFCKRLLFSLLAEWASQNNLKTIVDGTNADDLHVYRPGQQAVKEFGVRSPLAEAGLDKAAVRELAIRLNVPNARQPSAACLATRFPYGVTLTESSLRNVEKAEAFLKDRGFANFRVRCHGDLARLELSGEAAVRKLWQIKSEVRGYFQKCGFHFVTLDLQEFRSGSFDR